ncbi:MAG: Septum formation [Ilumatobacteraceae bacterium]|nr:Septum formation [Ilumatobacteraceae bacterium]
MNVADLAAELEVPTSMILDQCQRFGIDASWSGAELSGADLVLLRAELAAADPIDLRPADVDAASTGSAAPDLPAAPAAPDAPASPAPGATDADADADAVAADPPTAEPAPLPPTAVGSMPELIDEVTPSGPASADPPAGGAASSSAPGFSMGGAGAVIPPATRQVLARPAPTKRRLERGARNSVVALVVALVAFAASNFTEIAVLVLLLWLVTIIALCVAVTDGIRGRRRVQTHPERFSGQWLATIAVVLAIGGIVGLTASVVGAVGDDPAADAPLGVGKLQSVQVARWGHQRVQRYSDNGWRQPARDEGSCWEIDPRKQRDENRVETPDASDLTQCDRPHRLEVAKVFAYNHDADASYPSMPAFVKAADKQCGALHERLVDKGVAVQLQVEVPTEVGWGDGDHDVACVLITDERAEPLLS